MTPNFLWPWNCMIVGSYGTQEAKHVALHIGQRRAGVEVRRPWGKNDFARFWMVRTILQCPKIRRDWLSFHFLTKNIGIHERTIDEHQEHCLLGLVYRPRGDPGGQLAGPELTLCNHQLSLCLIKTIFSKYPIRRIATVSPLF